ncbi:unnamed protein product [Penicillium salamii]|nr:unnamed protein product [Penicillium salamii]
MSTSDKETVAQVPATTGPVQDKETIAPATTAETNPLAAEESTAEATRSTEAPSVIPSSLPPTYEDTQKEAVAAPPAAIINNGDSIEATRTQPTYPTYDEKRAMNEQAQAPVPVDPRLVPLEKLYDEPKLISCPFCYQNAMTRVNKESTGSTSMAALCCCLFGGICCAFLPYCMQMCHDSHHFCTNCGQKVALAPHDAPVQVFSPSNPGMVTVPPKPVQAPEAVLKN